MATQDLAALAVTISLPTTTIVVEAKVNAVNLNFLVSGVQNTSALAGLGTTKTPTSPQTTLHPQVP